MPKSKIREHPALTSARRAIRRNATHLTPHQVFLIASLTETFRFGEDRARWIWTADNARELPEHHWTCDDPRVTNGGAR